MSVLFGRALLLGALCNISAAVAEDSGAKTQLRPLINDPASACAAVGGAYLDPMKCRLANGSVVPILFGEEAARARASDVLVKQGSPEAWALATSALMFEVNGESHEVLAGAIATDDARAQEKRQLSKWWGIENRAQFLKMLAWLQFQGHRTRFEGLGILVDGMSDWQYSLGKSLFVSDPEQLHELEIIHQDHRLLGAKGLLGWDLIRYIALCRWGNLVGYLSEQEAWSRIMPAALRLQQTFESWQDLQNNYLVGRQFWSLAQTQRNGQRFQKAYDKLNDDASGPWILNPWNMDLGVAKPLQIERP